MAELHSCFPLSPFDTIKKARKKASDKVVSTEYKGKRVKSRRVWRFILLCLGRAGCCSSLNFRRELPDVSGRQEVHDRLDALLHGEQLRDFQVSASARSPFRRFSHFFPQCPLLVFPSATEAEELLLRLGYGPASATARQAFAVVSVSERFKVRPHCLMTGLQSVEPGC